MKTKKRKAKKIKVSDLMAAMKLGSETRFVRASSRPRLKVQLVKA